MSEGLKRCRAVAPGEAVEALRARRGPHAVRMAESLEALLGEISSMQGRGVRVDYVVIFGSAVDPLRELRVDSDIDVIIVASKGSPLRVLAQRYPEVVRLKRLPDGSIDAHTQLLDPVHGVAWHVIEARPSDVGEKLEYVRGPCLVIKV